MVMTPSRFPVQIQTVSRVTPNVHIYEPRVAGLPDDVQRRINQAIEAQGRQLIAEQKKVQIEGTTEMQGYYELKTNQRSVLSLILTNYAYTPPMAHGMTYAKSLTFNVQTGRAYSLKELFKPGSDYVRRISDLIRAQIKEREIPLLGDFKGIRPDQDYYIADKALVVYFQLYEISPYYVGFPMFPISVYALQDLIEESSPLGKMLADI